MKIDKLILTESLKYKISLLNINDQIRTINYKIFKTKNQQIITNHFKNNQLAIAIAYADYIKITDEQLNITSKSDLNIIATDYKLLIEILLATELFIALDNVSKSQYIIKPTPSWLNKLLKYDDIEHRIYQSPPNLKLILKKIQILTEEKTQLELINISDEDELNLNIEISETKIEQIINDLADNLRMLYHTNIVKFNDNINQILKLSFMLELYQKKCTNQHNKFLKQLSIINLTELKHLIVHTNNFHTLPNIIKNFINLNLYVNFDNFNEVISEEEINKICKIIH